MRWELLATAGASFVALAVVMIVVLSGCGAGSSSKNVAPAFEPGFTISPDGKRAAIIANDKNLYVLDLEKGSVLQVTQTPSAEPLPALPNGGGVDLPRLKEHAPIGLPMFPNDSRWLFYLTANPPHDTTLVWFNLENQSSRISILPGTIDSVQLSPQWDAVAYVANIGIYSHIVLKNLVTGEAKDLTPPGATSDRYPHFFPDGKRILFVRGLEHAEGNAVSGSKWLNNDFYSIGVDGTNLKQISHLSFSDNRLSLLLSDKGRRMYFSVFEAPVTGVKDAQMSTVLFSMATNGAEETPTQIPVAGTPKPYEGGDNCSLVSMPADGSKILFTSDRAKSYTYDYWVMNADGSAPIQLSFDGSATMQTQRNGAMADPVFAADGSRIYYYDRTTQSLMSIDPDGKNARPVGTLGVFANPFGKK